MNHSSIGHSDEVMLALRKPEILLYLTMRRFVEDVKEDFSLLYPHL